MFALALILAAQFTAQPAAEGRFDGTCLYPEALQERATQGELVTCNQAEISSDSIAFGLRSWQSRTRFNGSFEGDRMTVSSVTLPNGRNFAVRGVCELYYADEELSTVACTASGNRGSILANFVVSRF
jgi:hypothetical protein